MGIEFPRCVKYSRSVEMFQWVVSGRPRVRGCLALRPRATRTAGGCARGGTGTAQESRSEKEEDKIGGGKEVTVTYSYSQQWSSLATCPPDFRCSSSALRHTLPTHQVVWCWLVTPASLHSRCRCKAGTRTRRGPLTM